MVTNKLKSILKKRASLFFIITILSNFQFNLSTNNQPNENADNYDIIDITQYKIDQDPNNNYDSNSGYHALKNGILIFNGIKYNFDPTHDINNNDLIQNLFQDKMGSWKSYIINLRSIKKGTKFIKYNLMRDINDNKKSSLNKNSNIHYYLANTLNQVINTLKNNYLENTDLVKTCEINSEIISNIFADTIINEFNIKDKTELIKLLPNFKDIKFKVCDKILKDLTEPENIEDSLIKFEDTQENSLGDWLSAEEILSLYKFEKKHNILNQTNSNNINEGNNNCTIDFPITCIKDLKTDVNSILNAINTITTSENTLLIINIDNRWVTCFVNRTIDKIKYFAIDLFNANLIENVNFQNFVKLINLAAKEISQRESKDQKNDLNNILPINFNNLNNKESEEKNDYRSPYFDIETDQLPNLEDFFNGSIPNQVLNLIDKLKSPKKNNFKTDTKKGLILYGPPGTGKSTIAEIIARQSGREVLFIDGGSFKTEYQGSGARIVSELFAAAKAKNKPVVIIIDEIDGATSKLRKNFGTSEDNQTMKKIISELNKNLLSKDSSIYLICTTNYLENIESAILNRFTAIEVNAPDYNARLNILSNYLKTNDIIIEDNNNKNNYEVSQEFLKILATATVNWTGRDLQNLVNNAVSEYKNPSLQPEKNSVWKFITYNKLDFENRKLKSLLYTPILGFIPLLTYKKNYTRLEKFLYSSYLNEFYRMQKIKNAESETIQNNESIVKLIKNTTITTTVNIIIGGILYKAYDYFVPKKK